MTNSLTMTSSARLKQSLDLFEVKPGVQYSMAVLKAILVDVETALFFAKVYELDYVQTSNLLAHVLNSNLADELFRGSHSEDLQGFILDMCEDRPDVDADNVTFKPDVPHGEILPEVWKQLEVEVASSIKAVTEKLGATVSMMPGKQGNMLFKTLAQLNAKRPTIGTYRAAIQHGRQAENLVIMDVSGSMTSGTVEAIVDDVVAMSYMANAAFAIVSNSCFYWKPGEYDSATVLQKAEFGGTYYDTLRPLFENRDWGTVITVADYDSSLSSKEYLATHCNANIELVLDISLVNRPTFLAECVGQLAKEVRPILIGQSYYPMSA